MLSATIPDYETEAEKSKVEENEKVEIIPTSEFKKMFKL